MKRILILLVAVIVGLFITFVEDVTPALASCSYREVPISASSAYWQNGTVVNYNGIPTRRGTNELTLNLPVAAEGEYISAMWVYWGGSSGSAYDVEWQVGNYTILQHWVNPAYPYSAFQISTYNIPGKEHATSITFVGSGERQNYVEIRDLKFRYTPDCLQASFTPETSSGIAPLSVAFENHSVGADTYLWNFGDGNTATAVNVVHEYAFAGNYLVSLTATDSTTGDTDTAYGKVYVGGQGASGVFTRPLTETDEDDEFGIFEVAQGIDEIDSPGIVLNPAEHLAVALSDNPGDYVYAAARGQIAYIESIGTDCAGLYHASIFRDYCLIRFSPEDVTGDDYANIPTPGFETGGDYIFSINRTNLYRVGLTPYDDPNGGTFEYIVANADNSISVGQIVDEGCILGETASGDTVDINLGIPSGITVIPVTSDYGFTFVSYFDDEETRQPLVDSLTIYPDPTQACNSNPAYRACLTDAEFSNEETWTVQGDVTWRSQGNPAVLLQPGARVYQAVQLDPLETYSMSVLAAVDQSSGVAGAATIQLELGNTIETSTVQNAYSGGFDTYLIEGGVHTSDLGNGRYSAAVANIGSVPIEVRALCVTSGESSTSPGTCYFSNSQFDNGASGWQLLGSTSTDAGVLNMTDGSQIKQAVRLSPAPGESTHIYTVDIRFRPWREFTASPLLNATSATLWFDYQWQNESPESIYDSTSGGLAGGPANGNQTNFLMGGWQTIRQEITISSEINAYFVLEADINTGGDTTVLGVQIDSICLNAPHYLTDEDGNNIYDGHPPDYLVYQECHVVPFPTTSEPYLWIQWAYYGANNFFKCDLMKAINRTYETINSFYKTVGWAIRWFETSTNQSARWLGNQLVPWLNGHFRNFVAAAGSGQPGSGGVGLWDVLLALINNVLSPILDLIRSIVDAALEIVGSLLNGVIAIVLGLITVLFNLFNTAISATGSLVGAWNNAEPADISWLPNCTADPRSNPFCATSWLAENTLFAGVGIVIIPLLISIGSIDLILMVVGEIRRAFRESGQVS